MKKRILDIFKSIMGGTRDVLKIEKKDQLDYLNGLNSFNLDLIKRSYYQYKCQNYLSPMYKRIIANVFGFFGVVPFIIYALSNKMKNVQDEEIDDSIAVFIGSDINIIPESLFNQYRIIKFEMKFFLKFKDIRFIIREIVTRYPISFHFIFKCLVKIALYRANIERYNPSTFIVTSEYSFTSSALTKYCEKNNIRHFNVMHGEKLFDITDSFFQFHRCYIWDEHYRELFISLMADKNQFIIEIPNNFTIKEEIKPSNESNLTKKIATYYLQAETVKQLISIRQQLEYLKEEFLVVIRPHPIYSNKRVVRQIFSEFIIEDLSKINIYQSIVRSELIISLFSTVLYQGYLYNKKIVINDLVDRNLYEKLLELDYIMLKKNHTRLSDIICFK